MPSYTLLVEDDRHSSPISTDVEADSERDARKLAIQKLHETEHHRSVEVRIGDTYLAKVERLDIDLGAVGLDTPANDDDEG